MDTPNPTAAADRAAQEPPSTGLSSAAGEGVAEDGPVVDRPVVDGLVVALVRGFQGVRGGVRVEVLTDDPVTRYAPGHVLHVEGNAASLTIVEARPADPGWVLHFREVPTRNAAEALRDRYLEVGASEVPRLPRGRYYWHEFVGVPVSDPGGAPLGVVREVYRSGGAEMLIVEGGPRGSFDLPVARPFIRTLAPRQGRIVADPDALDLPGPDEIKPPPSPRPPRPRRATRRRPAVPMPPPRVKPGVPGDQPEPATPAPAESVEPATLARFVAPAEPGALNEPGAPTSPPRSWPPPRTRRPPSPPRRRPRSLPHRRPPSPPTEGAVPLEIDLVTLFPEMVEAPLRASIPGRILEQGLAIVRVHDLREWGIGRHRSVDDYTYGGGAGMVLRPEPVAGALAALRRDDSTVILLDPAGEVFRQARAESLARCAHLVLLCPRYEGVDDRIRAMVDLELSIGDYVLTGGELPALVICDAVLRLLPGAIDAASLSDESFSSGLLEYPQFTRPAEFEGATVPDVLVSGHHEQVRRWRVRESLRRTLERRPDLLDERPLSKEESALLAEIREEDG